MKLLRSQSIVLCLIYHAWIVYLLSMALNCAPPMASSTFTGSGSIGKNYYTVLDVPSTATEEEIKKAYRKLAMKVCRLSSLLLYRTTSLFLMHMFYFIVRGSGIQIRIQSVRRSSRRSLKHTKCWVTSRSEACTTNMEAPVVLLRMHVATVLPVVQRIWTIGHNSVDSTLNLHHPLTSHRSKTYSLPELEVVEEGAPTIRRAPSEICSMRCLVEYLKVLPPVVMRIVSLAIIGSSNATTSPSLRMWSAPWKTYAEVMSHSRLFQATL